MTRIFRIAKHELVSTLLRKKFIIIAFVLPWLVVLFVIGFKFWNSKSDGETPPPVVPLELTGYVDLSGIIRQFPDGIPEGLLAPFTTETQAQAALRSGRIAAYYLVPLDYLSSGKVYYFYRERRILLSEGQDQLIRYILFYNLLGGDVALIELLQDPLDLIEIKLPGEIARDAGAGEYLPPEISGDTVSTGADAPPESSAASAPGGQYSQFDADSASASMGRGISFILVVFLFVAIMFGSNLLLVSFTKERENRTMEIILSSVSPDQILAGKLLGKGTVGLLQSGAWFVLIYLLNPQASQISGAYDGISPLAVVIAWSILFFLAGYVVYAGLMAGVGVLAPRIKEIQPTRIVILLPLMMGYFFGVMAAVMGALHSPLVVFMSFFPLTAPVVMPARLVDGSVPFWQPLLSLILTGLSALLILRWVAAIFQVQFLFTGQSFSLRKFFALFRSVRRN